METNYSKLSHKAKKSWILGRLIFLVILIAITVAVFLLMDRGKARLIICIVMGVFIFLQLLNTFLYPIIEYNQWKYSITEEKIELVHGIYSITTSVIPIVRIQNIDIHEGPINRIFSLANIGIVTAGSHFKIPNLEKSKADEICKFLRQYVNIKVAAELEETNGQNQEES